VSNVFVTVSSPLKDRIVQFLCKHRNIRYECAEIHAEVGGGLGSVRRAAGRLAKDGIISSVEGANRRMLYFLSWSGGDPGGGGSPPDHSPDHSLDKPEKPVTESLSEIERDLSDPGSLPGSLNQGGGENENQHELSDPGSLNGSQELTPQTHQGLQAQVTSDLPSDPPSDLGVITDQMNDCILKIENFLNDGVEEFAEPLIEAYAKELNWTTAQIEQVRSQLSSRPRAKKMKILVVDDEPDNLDLLYRTFRRDFNVLKAESGVKALELLEEEGEVAVIISDQRMPEMKGTEFLSRTLPQFPDTVRIILTGFTDIEDLVEAINSGQVYKYITKPWDSGELKDVVQRAAATYDLLKQRTEELRRANGQMELLTVLVEETQTADSLKEILRVSCFILGDSYRGITKELWHLISPCFWIL